MTIQAGSVEVGIGVNLDPLKEGLKTAEEITNDSVAQLNKAANKASDSFDGFSKNTKKEFEDFRDTAVSSLNDVSNAANSLNSSLGLISQSIKGLGFGAIKIGATSATGALVSLAKKGLQATDFLETSRTAMSGLTGSFEEGNKAMSLAANYWQNNPFQRIDVTNATKQLVQFGRTTNDIASDLEILGNVSLSTGMDIDELARYYARVSSSGRAMTMDIEMMSDRGVPIYRELTKALNTTTEGVRKMASEGKIDFETFRKAMEGAVSAEAMEQYENTMARQTDRLKGSIQIIAGELAGYKVINNELVISEQGLEKAWTRLLKTVATGLRSQEIKDAMQQIGSALAKIVDKITQIAEPAFKILAKALQFVGDNASLLIPIIGLALTTFSQAAAMIPGIGGIIAKVSGPINGLKEGLIGLIKQKPGLVLLFSVLSVGFADAYKNDEEFRTSIQELVGSLKELTSVLMGALKDALADLVEGFKAIATSDAVKTILKVAAQAMASLAKAIASIPPENLAGIVSFFVGLRYINSNPIMVAASAVLLLVTYFKQLAEEGKSFPEILWNLGKDMMVGLFNGIVEGAKKIIQFVKDLANTIVTTIKKALGIHSPSTVMYGVGENISLGLANGIEDSSNVVQVAMNNLASDILSLSQKVIGNKIDFGLLDVVGQYQEWKKVSKLFTQGSQQYNAAIEKMEDARKQANLQILSLQEQYNNALDQTIDKIANMYGLFDNVDISNTTNSSKIIGNLDKQLAKMNEWAEAQNIIENLNLDDALKKELSAMGVTQVSELAAIANMTESELETFNDMWLQKQELAEKQGIRQMADYKEDTLNEIRKIKDGIDGETIDVEDIGGRLVSNIGEGIVGALPTLDSAFSQLGDYIEKAKKALKGTTAESADSGLGTDDNVPDANDITKSVTDELKATGEKLKSMIPQILLGLIGAWGLKTFLPKIFSKLSSMVAPGAISGIFKKLFGNVGQAAQEAAKATKPVESIAQSANVMSDGVQNVSKSMSKADKFLDTIKKGAQTIIWIAGAIAAVGAAIWVSYTLLKDIDFGKYQLCLIEMAESVAVFGIFAKLADTLQIGIKGILVIAGIAADIAVVALACKAAYDLMAPIEFVRFAAILGEMALAVGAFGLFAGIFGIGPVALAETLGLLVIAGIAGDLVLVALACKNAYDAMKDVEWEHFGNMLGQMSAALGVMGGFGAVLGLLLPLEALGWASITMICDELVKVSRALWVVYNVVPDDLPKVTKKLDYIKQVLVKIIDIDLGRLIGSIVASWSAGPLERTMEMYSKVAEELAKMSKLDINEDKVNENLDHVKSALEKVRSKTGIISGWLRAWSEEANANSVESAARVVLIYGEVADTLSKLGNVQIPKDAEEGVVKITRFMQKVLEALKNNIKLIEKTDYGEIEKAVGDAQSIINKFTEIIPTVANGLLGEKVPHIDTTKTQKVIENVGEVVTQIIGFMNDPKLKEVTAIGRKEEIVGRTQSILNKFTEIVPTIDQLVNQLSGENKVGQATDAVENIKTLIEKIQSIDGKVKTSDLSHKETVLDKTQSILNKLTQLAPTIAQLNNTDLGKNPKDKIVQVRDLTYELGLINTDFAKTLPLKMSVLDATQSIINKFTEIAPVIGQLSKTDMGDDPTNKVRVVRDLVYELGLINTSQARTLADKEWVVGMASSIAWKLKEFSDAMSSIGSVDGNIAQQVIQTMYSMFNALAGNLNTNATMFEQVGANIGNNICLGIRLQTPQMMEAGYQLQAGLWSAIESKMPDEYQQGAWMATQFGNGLKSVNFNDVGATIQSSVWWGIQNRMNDEYYQGRSMGERFRQGLYDIDYGNAGWWAVQGFINGAWGRAGAGDGVYHTGWWIANNFLQGLKDRGRQGSPWKTTMESGNWAVEGLIEGLQEQEGALVVEATNLADEVVEALTMDDLTMTPTLDAQVAPSMDNNEYGMISGNGRNVVINQENNNYTEYDIERVQQDLAWALSRA